MGGADTPGSSCWLLGSVACKLLLVIAISPHYIISITTILPIGLMFYLKVLSSSNKTSIHKYSELHIVWILLLEEPLVEGVGPVLLELGPVQEVLEGEARAEAEQDPERSVAGHVVANLGLLYPPVTLDLDGFLYCEAQKQKKELHLSFNSIQ